MDARIIKEIISQKPLDKGETKQATARSQWLANVVSNAEEIGLVVEVIRLPEGLIPCTGDQVDG